MASRPSPALTPRPLAELTTSQVRSLLAAERRAWSERLSWDIADAADLVEQAVRCGVLPGAAVLLGGSPVGYLSYQVSPSCVRLCSALLSRSAPPDAAEKLVEAALDGAPAAWDRRLEGQLTVFEHQDRLDAAFAARSTHVVPRSFLALDLPARARLKAAPAAVQVGPFDRVALAACADVLVAAHAGGVEATINSAFRETSAAVGYLTDLVVAGGCGRIHADASSMSLDDGRLTGFCLVTLVAPGVAHIPQVAVDPAAQGTGTGAALLRRVLSVLDREGCRRLTLSVSRDNERAAGWYLRLGFREATRFSAYWREP